MVTMCEIPSSLVGMWFNCEPVSPHSPTGQNEFSLAADGAIDFYDKSKERVAHCAYRIKNEEGQWFVSPSVRVPPSRVTQGARIEIALHDGLLVICNPAGAFWFRRADRNS